MTRLVWTPERVSQLVKLRERGASAQGCADEMRGFSRSAILGKLKRLGMLGTQKRRVVVERPKPVRTGRFVKPPSLPPKPLPVEPPQTGPGISLDDLTNTSCRWPSGGVGTPGFCFCGRSGADFNAGKPYCAEHTRRSRP